MRRTTLMLALLILGCALANAAVYRWVDANGKVHYSDKPPAAGTKPLPIKSSPTDPSQVEAREKTHQKTLDQYAKQESEQDKAQAQAEKKAAERKAACQQAQQKLTQLEQARRVTRTDKDGNKVYLDADQIDAAHAKAQAEVDKLCNGPG